MPSAEVASLDEDIRLSGENVILRRVYGQGSNKNNVDVTIRAAVRTYQAVELLGGINETDSKVIISPTDIAKANWPGGELPSSTVADPSLPKITDRIVIQGRVRTIAVVQPIYGASDGGLARIEMRVLG